MASRKSKCIYSSSANNLATLGRAASVESGHCNTPVLYWGDFYTRVIMVMVSQYVLINRKCHVYFTTDIFSPKKHHYQVQRSAAAVFPPGEISDLPTVLYVPVLHPCMTEERLCVTVDTMKGTFLASMSGKG